MAIRRSSLMQLVQADEDMMEYSTLVVQLCGLQFRVISEAIAYDNKSTFMPQWYT